MKMAGAHALPTALVLALLVALGLRCYPYRRASAGAGSPEPYVELEDEVSDCELRKKRRKKQRAPRGLEDHRPGGVAVLEHSGEGSPPAARGSGRPSFELSPTDSYEQWLEDELREHEAERRRVDGPSAELGLSPGLWRPSYSHLSAPLQQRTSVTVTVVARVGEDGSLGIEAGLSKPPPGTALWREGERAFTITKVVPGGEAELEGLLCVGDVILGIDGRALRGMGRPDLAVAEAVAERRGSTKGSHSLTIERAL